MRTTLKAGLVLAALALGTSGCAQEPLSITSLKPLTAHAAAAPALDLNSYDADLLAFIARQTSDGLDAPATVGAATSTASTKLLKNGTSAAGDPDDIESNLSPAAKSAVNAEDDLLAKETSANKQDGVIVTSVRVALKDVSTSQNTDGSTTVNDEVFVSRHLTSGQDWESVDSYVSTVKPDGTIYTLSQPDVNDFSANDPSQSDGATAVGAAYVTRADDPTCDDICDNGDPATDDPYTKNPENNPGDGGGSGILSSAQKAAVGHYADTYADNWNTSTYPDLKSSNDDCTDFISQALKAGGWKSDTVGSTYDDNHHWWYSKNSNNASHHYYSKSWTSATAWRAFARYKGWVTSYSNPGAAAVGDIVQIDVGKDGSIDHSMVVTSTGNGSDPLLSAHTRDRHNMPYSTYVVNAQNQNPGKPIAFLFYTT